MRVATLGPLLLLMTACTQGDTRPPLSMLPQSFPPYGVEFTRYREPLFPLEMNAMGVTQGYAVIAVTIDANGRVSDAIGIEASDDAFVDAVLETTSEWLFAPVRDPPTEPRREVLHYRFRLSGAVNVLTHREGAEEAFAENADDFARIRTVRYSDMKVPPIRLMPETDTPRPRVNGTAEINFIIDETGKVRVPAIVSATDWDAALIALGAVENWQFTPPEQNGKPVLVEVQAKWGD